MDRRYWQRKLQVAEAELDAARTRTQVNEAAKKLQYAKARLGALEPEDWVRSSQKRSRSENLPVVRARRTLPHNLLGFVDFEARLLQVLYDPLGNLLAGIVRRVLLEQTPQQSAAAGDREADRECELVAEGAMIHGYMFWFCSLW